MCSQSRVADWSSKAISQPHRSSLSSAINEVCVRSSLYWVKVIVDGTLAEVSLVGYEPPLQAVQVRAWQLIVVLQSPDHNAGRDANLRGETLD